MSDVFISHVEEDSRVAEEIAGGLEAAGYSCWYYERDSYPGPSYIEQIGQAITQCRAVVLVLSPACLGSGQVDKEVDFAHECDKPFIPVLRDMAWADFQQGKPKWRILVGTASAIQVPRDGGTAIVPRIIRGLQGMGLACPLAPPPDVGRSELRARALEGGLAFPQSRAQAPLAEKILAGPSGSEGERRPVTVLVAHISGFTALAESLDPEDVAPLVDRCLGAMGEVIELYEGAVDKYGGDAVMAFFGAPVAHEDDPERAIRAALQMRGRIAAIDRELQDSRPHSQVPGRSAALNLHGGINTGTVITSAADGSRQRDYTVLSDAVNVASRLEELAGSGEIIVGERAYRLARHAVAFEPLGELTLQGRAEPLPAYRVLGLLAAPGRRGLEAYGLVTPLIGRTDELSQLLSAFERMLRGQTQIVSVIGEAGAGKSRLLRELFDRLEEEGRLADVTVRRAVCSPLGQRTYGVVADFLRDGYGIAPDDPPDAAQDKLAAGLAALGSGPEEITRTAPLVGHLLGIGDGDPSLRYVEPEQLKRQLLLAMRSVVEMRLRRGPLVLVVEDLHWADASSVELLRYLTDRLGDRRLMLLTTHRPAFDAGSLVSGRAAYGAIRLAPLSADESEALVSACFGASVTCMPARLRETIVARAGGNPFYLEEVVRGLIDNKALVREADGWVCRETLTTLEVPATVQALLLARLDRLPPGARRMIQEASVLGPTFGETLLRALDSEPQVVRDQLDLLQEAELVHEIPPGPVAPASGGHVGAGPAEQRYRFTHTLVQEVAYQSLSRRRRAELHGRAAEDLEAICAGQPSRLEDLEALGHHFSLSPDRLRGVRYLTAAGDWARGIYANEDAARHYERALGTLSGCDAAACHAELLTVRERLADVLGPLGRHQQALEHYEAVVAAHGEDGDRPAQARLRRKIGGLYWHAGDPDGALAQYQAGLELLDGAGDQIEKAHLYQEMGRLAFHTGDNQGAISRAGQALALAERLAAAPETGKQAAETIAQAHNTLGVALARTGELEEAVRHIERSVAVAQEHDLPQVACRGYTNLGVLYSTLDPGRAIESCRTGLALAKKIGDLSLQSWLYANLAGAYCSFTNRCEDEAIAAVQTAIELDRRLGQLDHLAVPLIVLGQIYQCHGEPDLARKSYEEALSLAQEMREPQLLFPCYDGLATLRLELGDEAGAQQFMLLGQKVCEECGLDADSLVVLPFLY